MRILLTGATGFLGSHLLPVIMARGEVWVLGTRCPPVDGVHFVAADLSGSGIVRGLPDRIDVVVHLAQSHRFREFPAGAGDMFAVNVAATAQLLDYAQAAGARHFLLASTGSVYHPYTGGLAEDDTCTPTDFYPASKLAAEALVRAYASHFPACILRLFFLYGLRQTDRLVPGLIQRLRSGVPVTLAGSVGKGLVITPTDVADAVQVIAAAIDARWDTILNVASPEALDIRRMATILAGALGVEPHFTVEPGPEPMPIVPDLSRLAARYPLERFRSFAVGAGELVVGDAGSAVKSGNAGEAGQ